MNIYRAWRWVRHESGITAHGVLFTVATLNAMAGLFGWGAFWMAAAVYWLVYDRRRVSITVLPCPKCGCVTARAEEG